MLGKPVEVDLTDDGWTQHYAAVQNPPKNKDWSFEEYLRNAEAIDYRIMEDHRRRVEELVGRPPNAAEVAQALLPVPLQAALLPRRVPAGVQQPQRHPRRLSRAAWTASPSAARSIAGKQYDVDCLIYGTGFEAELTPLFRRAGHDIVGRGGVTLAEKWADGAASLFGMMSRGFPNMFVMPAPGQQAVVTVNYTQLAVLGAEFVGAAIGLLDKQGVRSFDVAEAAEEQWTEKIVASFVDASSVMAACTPSRINLEGNPQAMNPRNGNYGRGRGDYFKYRDLLQQWLADGGCDGLELDAPPGEP